MSVHAVAAIRLLMLTGCRKSEILSLQWTDIDLEAGELRLRESKTGPRAVPLSPPAAKVLAELPRVPGNPWVIPGQKPDTHMTNLDDPWRIVRERAGVENVRIHDCRHSFASRALALGESLPVIAKLLGHSQIRTTARYAHLARDSVRAAAARVAASIAEDFLKGGSATAKLPGDRVRTVQGDQLSRNCRNGKATASQFIVAGRTPGDIVRRRKAGNHRL